MDHTEVSKWVGLDAASYHVDALSGVFARLDANWVVERKKMADAMGSHTMGTTYHGVRVKTSR